MICPNCGCDVSEKEAVYNDDAPAQAFHEDCYDEYYCECGERATESGMCSDCLFSFHL